MRKSFITLLLLLAFPFASIAGPAQQAHLRLLTALSAAPAANLLDADGTSGDTVFTNTQVLDSAAEGVPTGSMTVTDTAAGVVETVSNEFKVTGPSAWSSTGLTGLAVTKTLGTTLFHQLNRSAGAFMFTGWDNGTTLGASNSAQYSVYFSDTNALIYRSTFSSTLTGDGIAAATDYDLAYVMGGYDSSGIPYNTGDTKTDFKYGISIFIKGGVYTSWTLLWRDHEYNTTPLYAVVNTYNSTATLDDLKIPNADLSAVQVATYHETTTDESDHDIGIADIYDEVAFTTPGSGTDPLDIVFRKSDASNYWLIRITPGTAGTDTELIKVVAGTPTTLDSTDMDWATSTAYVGKLLVEGADYFKFIAWVLNSAQTELLAYTSTDTFNQAETIIDLVKNSFTVSWRSTFPRTSATYTNTFSTYGY